MNQKQTPKQIEDKVRKEYLTDKYKALCEVEVETEYQIEYLESEEGKKLNVDEAGEVSWEETIKRAEKTLTKVRANKEFILDQINADGKVS